MLETSTTTSFEKRNSFSLFLLWLVMQANYVNLYIGLAAAHSETPLVTVVTALFFSTAFYTVYGAIAGMNGAMTGKRLVQLAQDEFGNVGGVIAGAIVVVVPAAWYCFNVIVASDVLILLFPQCAAWKTPMALLLIALMSFNNLFGFNGIVKFAQYIAAPVLIVGILVALSSGALVPTGSTPINTTLIFDLAALQFISTSLLGNATWGNEEDFWRYAKPTFKHCSLPIIAANFIGLFGITMLGYFGSRYISAGSDIEALKEVTLIMGFGSPIIAALLTIVHMVAFNDSNMFSSLNGMERFIKLDRSVATMMLVPVLVLFCYLFLNVSVVDLLFMVAGFCGTVLPSIGLSVWCSRKVARELPVSERRNAFLFALIVGISVGVITSAHGSLLPGIGLSLGISILQAWATTLLVFFIFVKVRLAKHQPFYTLDKAA